MTAYLEGRQLSEAQLDALKAEEHPGAPLTELLAGMHAALKRAEEVYRALDPGRLTEARLVGRRALPSTVIGLLVHIAEHTLRHTGQCVTTAKIVRA